MRRGSGGRFVRERDEAEEAGECSERRVVIVVGFAGGLCFRSVTRLLYKRRAVSVWLLIRILIVLKVSEVKSGRGSGEHSGEGCM